MEKVNGLISELSISQQPVNLELILIDTSDSKNIERLPEVIQKSLQNGRKKFDVKKSGGFHVVFSPWGRELFLGQLDKKTIQAMSESPARKRLGELLAEGKLVAICLAPKKAEDNRLLAKSLEDLAKSIAEDSQAPQIEVARLDVSPDDPKEKWFVRNLMLTEPDLKDFAGQPMIFMAYGRGRSMLPYIGKGITVDNLTRCVTFLTGACSCEVKADNPGVDLLMRCDWEAAADMMAATDDEASTGDGQLEYREFDPSRLSGGDAVEDRKPELEEDQGGAVANNTEQTGDRQSGNAVDIETRQRTSFAARQTWILGGGLAFVVAVVVIGGLFFMRRSGV